LQLSLFRKHKDPVILKTQFEPLFQRARFLYEVSENVGSEALDSRVSELVAFVASLEMGAFYSERLFQLLDSPSGRLYVDLYESEEVTKHWHNEWEREYRGKLLANRDNALALVVELLRYQKW